MNGNKQTCTCSRSVMRVHSVVAVIFIMVDAEIVSKTSSWVENEVFVPDKWPVCMHSLHTTVCACLCTSNTQSATLYNAS